MTHRSLTPYSLAFAAGLLAGTPPAPLLAQTNLKYQHPSKAIVDLVDTRPTPFVEVSPADSLGKKWMLVGYISGFAHDRGSCPTGTAPRGLRFNPKTNGPSRGRYLTALGLQALPAGKEISVSGLARSAKIRFTAWAPDARHFAFINTSDAASDAGLSYGSSMSRARRAHRISGIALNGVFWFPCEWTPDSQSLLCKTVVDGRSTAPKRSEVPTGPVIQEIWVASRRGRPTKTS